MTNDKKTTERSEESQRNMPEKKTEKKKKLKPVNIAVISMAVLLAVASAVIIWFITRDSNPVEHEISGHQVPGSRGTVTALDNISDILDDLGTPIDDSYYITEMNVNWVFDRWDIPSSTAFVGNSIDNRRTVYFDLHLRETGELVYSSPFIPVGGQLREFALDTEVPAGNHSAIVTYYLVDDNYEEITTVSVTVTLIILE